MPKTNPKVSVIVPVYNTELYVERAIVSLMEQTLDDVQFIIIDDGSKDNSLSIIKQVIARYPVRQVQVILISRENCGVASTRAQGMRLATGDFVIHLDSDDWAELDWLEAMYTKAIADNADVVVCDYSAVYATNSVEVNMPAAKAGKLCLKQLLCDKQRGYTWNKLISQVVINKIDFPFVGGINYLEDFIYILKCFYYSKKVVYHAENLYNYNQQNLNSLTKGISSSKREDILRAVTCITDFLQANGDLHSYIKELMLFKIKQKSFLIYGEWENVRKQTWQLFPEAKRYVLAADIPIYFKLCMVIANFNLYHFASMALKVSVKLKFLILPRRAIE